MDVFVVSLISLHVLDKINVHQSSMHDASLNPAFVPATAQFSPILSWSDLVLKSYPRLIRKLTLPRVLFLIKDVSHVFAGIISTILK